MTKLSQLDYHSPEFQLRRWTHPLFVWVDALIARRLSGLKKSSQWRSERMRIFVTGTSGSGKSSFGYAYGICTNRSFQELDDLCVEIPGHLPDGDRLWVYDPRWRTVLNDSFAPDILAGTCDNLDVVIGDYNPNVILYVIPRYETYVKAVKAKAIELGSDHAFYDRLIARSEFTQVEFDLYIHKKLNYVRSFAREGLKRKGTRRLVIPVLNTLVMTSSDHGWADPRLIMESLHPYFPRPR